VAIQAEQEATAGLLAATAVQLATAAAESGLDQAANIPNAIF
jgi:hypothetical protein